MRFERSGGSAATVLAPTVDTAAASVLTAGGTLSAMCQAR